MSQENSLSAADAMTRNLSSRFQVDRVKSQSESSETDRAHSASAPDELESPREKQQTKGRFAVEGGRLDSTPSATESPSAVINGGAKAVHFMVGDSVHGGDRGSTSTEGYNTHNLKSFRNVETVERIPNINHYRNIMSIEGAIAARPTLSQLHEESPDDIELGKEEESSKQDGQTQLECHLEKFPPPEPKSSGPKFGWIQGVLVRCILNILGVMLYLRISWVAGQAGIGLGSAIILLSSLVTVITTISMCAITTNGEIKGGGAYFMISRSLGPEFGGSIGLIFAFANAVGVAMYVVGFAETVRDLMRENGARILDNDLNDIRIVGLVTVLLLLGVVMIGTGFESKMQMVLLGILLVSLVNYVIGVFIVTDEKKDRGMTGFIAATFTENFVPQFRGEGFFSVFGVFFPAATGIMAGANISGDLANPQKAIPKGTLLAILLTTFVYLGGLWFTGSTCVRDYPIMDCMDGFLNGTETRCDFGLMNDAQVMQFESGWWPLITAGIFAATLSSALASLVSAPKVFQAVCKDHLFPYIHVFAKGYGKGDEPRRAYILAFGIAVAMILIGDLNSIAPIISNFFLASYALINYAVFDASYAESPGFRPGFKYYNMWLSLFGAVLCIAVMFVIKWWTALLTFAIIAALYVYVHHRKPDVNWGSSTQAHSYRSALQAMLKLAGTEEHVKNFRPQILVLTGNPVARQALVDFVSNITKDTSLMICGHVIMQSPTEKVLVSVQKLSRQLSYWLEKRKTKAFYCAVANPSLRSGVVALIQLGGLGKLRPNILILGFKNNWQKSTEAQIAEYFGVIHDAFDSNLGVGILRLPQGLDFSELMKEHNIGDYQNLKMPEPVLRRDLLPSDANFLRAGAKLSECNLPRPVDEEGRNADGTKTLGVQGKSDSASSFAEKFSTVLDEEEAEKKIENNHEEKQPLINEQMNGEILLERKTEKEEKGGSSSSFTNAQEGSALEIEAAAKSRLLSVEQKDLLATINQFQRRVKKAVIDVWWLFDDGGLTLLVPHLLTSSKSYLEGAKLRIFTIASSKGQLESEQRSMAALLSKFRIEYSDVFVIPDITRKPAQSTVMEFEQIIQQFRAPEELDGKGRWNEKGISEAELLAMKDRTNRQLRTRELLLQHSKESSLVIMTLPVPRKGAYSGCLYMAWLELLTRDMPPILLLRGNQQSVLTFYS